MVRGSMKLNMGCGQNKVPGWINVDASEACRPDAVVDLEQFPWPWPDDSVEAVLFNHSLEHMGGDPKVFLRLMQELYRVCARGALVDIVVPHPRHDNFLGDPTHVRPISPAVLSLFSREANEKWRASGAANSPLALYTGVDFALASTATVLAEPYASRFKSGEMSAEAISEALRLYNNVAVEFRIQLRVEKGPADRPAADPVASRRPASA